LVAASKSTSEGLRANRLAPPQAGRQVDDDAVQMVTQQPVNHQGHLVGAQDFDLVLLDTGRTDRARHVPPSTSVSTAV